MSATSGIEELRAEARHHRERYDLYQAKMYGLRPITIARLRELERMYRGANARLRRVQQEQPRCARLQVRPYSMDGPVRS